MVLLFPLLKMKNSIKIPSVDNTSANHHQLLGMVVPPWRERGPLWVLGLAEAGSCNPRGVGELLLGGWRPQHSTWRQWALASALGNSSPQENFLLPHPQWPVVRGLE